VNTVIVMVSELIFFYIVVLVVVVVVVVVVSVVHAITLKYLPPLHSVTLSPVTSAAPL